MIQSGDESVGFEYEGLFVVLRIVHNVPSSYSSTQHSIRVFVNAKQGLPHVHNNHSRLGNQVSVEDIISPTRMWECSSECNVMAKMSRQRERERERINAPRGTGG